MKNRKKNYISRLSSNPKPFVKIEKVQPDLDEQEKQPTTSTCTIKRLLMPLQKNTSGSPTTSLKSVNVIAEFDSNANANAICIVNNEIIQNHTQYRQSINKSSKRVSDTGKQQQQLKRIRKIKDAFPAESSIFDIIQTKKLDSPVENKESQDEEIIVKKPMPNETDLSNKAKNFGSKSSSKIKDLFPALSPIKLKKVEHIHKAPTTNIEQNKCQKMSTTKQNRNRKYKASNKIKDLLNTNALAESINYEVQERENNNVPQTQMNIEKATNRLVERQVLKINNFYSNQLEECSKSEKIRSLLNSVDQKNLASEILSSNENRFVHKNSIQSKNKRMNSNQIKDLLKNELFLVQVKRKSPNKGTKISNLLNRNIVYSNLAMEKS